MEAQQQVNENIAQCTFCRGERDPNIWGAKNAENHDKNVQRCQNCQVFKSGHLFISSKGIGWTSWKRRWFILTRSSLVFFRSDPNSPAQRGGEMNLTLGGIDLNSSGSVVSRADKKLLTVLFPDGRDGRAFTLKAETLEEMNEWKAALENALAQAPNAALVVGQTGIFRNDAMESVESSLEQCRDKRTQKSMIIRRPVLLALEEIDGSPSFLEKALRFIEQYGIKVEGILRQSADVEEVEHRVQEYEKGKNEFDASEDAHLIGDCIKFVLREMPSSPVSASSCMAFLEALRSDRGTRISSMRSVVCNVLPEPNRRLLQRILRMMRIVASHRSENRMAVSAVAACMAPLLLRPLLAGDCELEDGMDIGGDGSIQLLQAAAAANHAQAIVITLLEAYEKIFDDDSFSSELCSDSEECDNDADDDEDYDDEDEGEEEEDDDDDNNDYIDGDESTDSETLEDDGFHDAQNELGQFAEDLENTSRASLDGIGIDLCHSKAVADDDIIETPKLGNDSTTIHRALTSHSALSSQGDPTISRQNDSQEQPEGICSSPILLQAPSFNEKLIENSNASGLRVRPPTRWGRTSARKNLSLESIDYSVEEDTLIQRLETAKSELQAKLTKEEQENVMLQTSIEKRKGTLHERRLALEDDVKRLQGQLRREKDLRACLEAGLMNMRPGHVSLSPQTDFKNVRGDLEEIALAEADVIQLKQKVADLRGQLGQRLCLACGQQINEQSKWVNTLTNVRHQRNASAGEVVCGPQSGRTLEHHPVDLSEEASKSTEENIPKEKSTPDGVLSDSEKSDGNLNVPEEVKSNIDEKSTPEKQQRKTNSRAEAPENQDASSESTSTTPPPPPPPPTASSSSSSLLSMSTASALSRLTHRLNFLKERRTQLANELQAADPETPPRQTNSR